MSAATAPTCVGAVLFTDLVGFTEFNEVVGDAQAVAALELMDSVETARQMGSFPLAIRMGIHHGEALARGDDVVGVSEPVWLQRVMGLNQSRTR